jgi:Zn-dependent protease
MASFTKFLLAVVAGFVAGLGALACALSAGDAHVGKGLLVGFGLWVAIPAIACWPRRAASSTEPFGARTERVSKAAPDEIEASDPTADAASVEQVEQVAPLVIAAAPEERRDLAELRAALVAPAASSSAIGVIVALLFLLDALRTEASVLRALTIAAVVAFHELGHAVAMKLSGYRDVRVFFVPGFGALTAGRADGVARWKEAIVLLAGPVPGLVIGVVLLSARPLSPDVEHLAVSLLLVNGFNLLPLGPLDGGRLVQIVLGRARGLEHGFLLIANALLVYVAYVLSVPLLGILGVLGFVSAGAHVRLGRAADALRARRGPLPSAAELDDATLEELLEDARRTLPTAFPAPPPGRSFAPVAVDVVRRLHEAARAEPLGAFATATIACAWLFAVAATFAGLAAGIPG